MSTITIDSDSFGTAPVSLTIELGTPGPQGIQGIQGPAGPSGVSSWGGITGTLSNQTDLQSELDGKYSSSNPSGFVNSAFVTSQGFLTSIDVVGVYQPISGMSSYAPKASPTFTGDPKAPTPATSDNDTSIATTAFVKAQGYATLASPTFTGTVTIPSGASISGYLTTSSAASNYAVIAAGQPISGTVGQVLTKNSGTNYDSSWTTLVQGDRYLTTSTTSNSIANGAKTFTVGTGLSYTTQQDVTIAYDAAHHMHAVVTSYNSGTGVLVVDVQQHTGTGTYTAWTVNVGGTVPAQSVTWGDIVGTLGDQSDLASALNAKLASVDAASTYTTFGYTASTYFPIAGGALSLNSNITVADTSNSDSEMAGFGFGVQMSNDHTKGTTVEFDGLDTYDGASHMQVNPTGLVFPDTSVQTTSATNLGYISQGTADGLYYSISNPNGFTSNSFNSTDAIQAVSNNYASSVSNNPSTGNYLKYNGMDLVWDTPGGGGGGTTWGTITGNLYDQTDLQGVLDSKYSTSNPSGFTNFSSMDAISAITGGYTSSIAGGATISGQVLTYNGSQIYWNAGFSAPSSSNSVWAYGNWYSANVTGIYDGYMNYYTVLTF